MYNIFLFNLTFKCILGVFTVYITYYLLYRLLLIVGAYIFVYIKSNFKLPLNFYLFLSV